LEVGYFEGRHGELQKPAVVANLIYSGTWMHPGAPRKAKIKEKTARQLVERLRGTTDSIVNI